MSKQIVGIDKLVLTTKEFILPTIPKMTPKPRKELGEQEDILAITTDGNEIRTGALYKDSRKLKTCSNVGISNRGLQVTFNPNKHYHQYRAYSDVKLLKQSLADVQKELKEIGIITDVSKMSTYRIDQNLDQEMSKPYNEYTPIYNSLGASRMKATPYTSGVSIKNKSAAAIFYDKGVDVYNRTEVVIPENNLIRNETRLLNSGVVKRHSGGYFSNVGNIIRYYDYKDEIHYKKVASVLKSLSNTNVTEQLEFTFADDIHTLQLFTDTIGKNKMMKFLSVVGGVDYIINTYGSIQMFESKVIDKIETYRQTKIRYKDQLREAYQQNAFLVKKNKERHREMKIMIDELCTKFLKSA